MEAIISERGQITLPKAVRVSLGLKPGTILDISVVGGQFVGVKHERENPIAYWRGKGRLPDNQGTDAYLAESRE